jgi:hypothetical protein
MHTPPAPAATTYTNKMAAKVAAEQAALARKVAPILGGYVFKQPALLVEALTHCTWNQPPCNQRLEFLGDSALDMITVAYLVRGSAHASNLHALPVPSGGLMHLVQPVVCLVHVLGGGMMC